MARVDPHSEIDLVPAASAWDLANGEWKSKAEGEGTSILQMTNSPLAIHLASPRFELQTGYLYSFSIRGFAQNKGVLSFALLKGDDVFQPVESWVRKREIQADGIFVGSFSFLPANDGGFRLVVANGSGKEDDQGALLDNLDFRVTVIGPVEAELGEVPPSTYLEHWGPVRRRIHDMCKRSRPFNALVQAIEMKLEREEVLSLPAFVALCPTGQCNALCDFCSVTINRTGIIKRQLPWENLARFLQPVQNVLQMCGLEGNGEPTMYKEFDRLLGFVKRNGSEVYLITNGSRLMPSQIPHVLNLNSVTFSLNAASAATHRAVMKLKNWPDVVRNIKSIVTERGRSANPIVHLSFVAYNYNIHEIVDFLQLGEYELKGDVLVIRPLSELGTDSLGTIEDQREIVPFESDVQDAIDAVQEYLEDVPRRRYLTEFGERVCDIQFDPSAFRNVRPDPAERVILPKGFEGRLLAPRRKGWVANGAGVRANWHLSMAHLICDGSVPAGVVWYSTFTPVDPNSVVTFECKVERSFGADYRIQVVDEQGAVIGETLVEPSFGEARNAHRVVISVNTGDNRQLALQIAHDGGAFWTEIDFLRLRTPGAMVRSKFAVPNERRWAADNPQIEAAWEGSELAMAFPGGTSGYLYKSYFTPCVPNQMIEFPLEGKVKGGEVVLGVIDQNAGKWIGQFPFKPGNTTLDVRFNTEENQRIQFIFFAKKAEAFEAKFKWGDILEKDKQRFHGPDANGLEQIQTFSLLDYAPMVANSNWYLYDGVSYADGEGDLVIDCAQGEDGGYVADYSPISVPRNTELSLGWQLTSKDSGQLSIGILDEARQSFIANAPMSAGHLSFDTATNRAVSIVISRGSPDPVSLSLNWMAADRKDAGDAPCELRVRTATLLPELTAWRVVGDGLNVTVIDDSITLNRSGTQRGCYVESPAVDLKPGQVLHLTGHVNECVGGAFNISAVADDGQVLAVQEVDPAVKSVGWFELEYVATNPRKVHAVVNASGEGELLATIAFTKIVGGSEILPALALPPLDQWQTKVPGEPLKDSGAGLIVEYDGPLVEMIAVTEPISTTPGTRYELPLEVTVSRGRLAISVINFDTYELLAQRVLTPGETGGSLRFSCHEDAGVCIKLHPAYGDMPLRAKINSGEASTLERGTSLKVPSLRRTADTEVQTAERLGESLQRMAEEAASIGGVVAVGEEASDAELMADILEAEVGGEVEIPPVDYRPLTSDELAEIATRRRKAPRKDSLYRRTFGRRSRKYFCQKPWTDLNNFSVDGRMDVCCMTTGASQSQFALGNILENDFQTVWNGPAIREFRRTVNTDAKLTPCDRCSMAYSYSGLFFAKDFTNQFIDNWFAEKGPKNTVMNEWAKNWAKGLLSRFHFKDFR